MAKIKYTKGEWVYSKDKDTHDYCIHLKNPKIEFGQVSHAHGIIGSSEWIWINDEDARLICGAPKMYELLDTMRDNPQVATLLQELENHK